MSGRTKVLVLCLSLLGSEIPAANADETAHSRRFHQDMNIWHASEAEVITSTAWKQYRSGGYLDAILTLKKISPSSETRYLHGRCLQHMGKVEEARKQFQLSTQILPKEPKDWFYRGHCKFQLSNYRSFLRGYLSQSDRSFTECKSDWMTAIERGFIPPEQ